LTTAHQQEDTVGATYQLNKPQVACEELVGDLILLHFGSGLYYNLRSTGADVCSYLLAGGTAAAAAQQLAAHFGLETAPVASDVAAFVETLVREGILVPADRPANDQPMRITAPAYEPPQCQKFDDMADQLLLDKIDDQSTNTKGWSALEL
jgi:hypothetical protein